MKRVLLTGATGLIGRHAIPPLLARGYEVHAVGRQVPAQHSQRDVARQVHWHTVDLLDAAQVSAAVREIQPTHLLHFAWYVAHGKFWAASENLDWVSASLTLLRAFAAQGGRRVVMSGTCAEYDWTLGEERLREVSSPAKPSTLYGTSKHALHLILERFAAQHKLSAAWGRIFFLYGPDEAPQRFVASVIRALLAGQPARMSHGNQVRDFLHVADVAEAFVAVLDSEVDGAVNIASGEPVTLKGVAETIGDLLHQRDHIALGALPAAQNDPPVLVADVSRLRHEVNWRPRLNLTDGLIDTIQWWKEHEDHN